MTWGFSSYETRFRWAAALWVVLMTVWCMCDLPWKVRAFGVIVWVAITLAISVRFAWWRPRSARDVPIFLLVGGCDDAGKTCYLASVPFALEKLVRNLHAAGYRFQTVQEALATPVRKSVVLTFDGGARVALERLLPLLQQLKVKATLFVTDRGERDPNFLKPLEIQALARSGLVAFGGSVERLAPGATAEAWKEAIVRNRRWIAGVQGALPQVFAYPEGVEAAELEEAVREAGYTAALTAEHHVKVPSASPFRLSRRILPEGYKPWQAYLVVTRGRFSLTTRK